MVKCKSSENFLKRFNFEMQEIIEEDNRSKTLINFNNGEKFPTFYIYCKNNNVVFDQTPVFEEELIINNNEDKNVFISKKDNIWNFYVNLKNVLALDHTIEPNKHHPDNIDMESAQKETIPSIVPDKLICFKFFCLTNQKRVIYPVIDRIVLANGNKTLNELVKENDLNDEYDKYLTDELISLKSFASLNYLQEFSTLREEIDFSNESFYYQPIFDPDEKISSFHNKFTVIMLNLSFDQDIHNHNFRSLLDIFLNHKADELFSDIYLRTNYMKNLKGLLNEEKQRFSLKLNEQTIKEIIYEKIKYYNELNLIIEDITYYDLNKNQFNFEKYKESFNPDFIEILRFKNENQLISANNHFYMKWSKIYPLTLYINPNDFTINYKVKVFTNNDYEKKKFCLFDRDNNFLKKICVELPKLTKRCCDVVNYLYNPILKSYYQDTPKEEFFFILQSEDGIMVLDMFINQNEHLYQHKQKQKIIYRIQPFLREEINEFSQGNKHFIAFLSKDNCFISYPILIFISTNQKVSELRQRINEKIMNIHCLNILEIPLDKYKLYLCNYNNQIPNKGDLIGSNKDDQLISLIQKYKTYNILVEVPINLENKQQLKIILNK